MGKTENTQVYKIRCDKCDDRREDSALPAHGRSGQGEEVLPGLRGFPEVVVSTLRPKGGAQVKLQRGRGRRISLAKVSVHVKDC